jgi:dihydrofolate synthase/folylpolyglutamate synthase
MSYAAAIEQLNAMVPELYTGAGEPRRKFSLDEIGILLGALGDPQLRFASVLIGGTNGKGSTAATLASILTASGVRAGLYTSPHLARVNERIRVDGAEIADESFASLYYRVHDAAQKLVLDGRLAQLPSFFEVLTAQALLYFAEAGVEIAVLEVGMGGRLDATNVVDPLLSVITDISLEHTEWLGPTIAAITREKAGILRRGGTLISLPQLPEANQVLSEVAAELGVHAVCATEYMPPASTVGVYQVDALGAEVLVDSPLAGAHQHRNVALAIAAAVELAEANGFPITPATMAAGIRQTRWPGRLEHIQGGSVEWILDVAHNLAGVWALRAGLRDVLGGNRKRTLVFSCLRDKPVLEMGKVLFPLFDEVIVAPIHNARAATMKDLEAAANAAGVAAVAADSVSQALELAARRTEGGVVVVSGSVYLVGEARPLLLAGGGRR